MKQPIAIEIKDLTKQAEYLTNTSTFDMFYTFTKNLKSFHELWFDKNPFGSVWLNSIREISNKITNQTHKDFFDNVFFRDSELLKIPIKIVEENNSTTMESVAMQTPDKLILSEYAIQKKKELNYVNLKQFNNKEKEFEPSNLLYRDHKVVEVPAGYKFNNFNFLKPYFRHAKKLEFIDKYLLDDKTESDLEFIKTCIILSPKLEKINLYTYQRDINPTDIRDIKKNKYIKERYKKFKEELSQERKMQFEWLQYNNSENHDRFIIINSNEFSLKFTTSFNNFNKSLNYFQTKKSFSIIIYKDNRKYIDK